MAPQALVRLHAGKSPPETTRQRVAHLLDKQWVESLIMILVVVDLACIATEVGIDSHVLCIGGQVMDLPRTSIIAMQARAKGHPHQSLAVDVDSSQLAEFCVEADGTTDGGHGANCKQTRRIARWEHGRPHDLASMAEHAEEILVCDTRDGHAANHIMHLCHIIGVTILCFFLAELLLKWWAAPESFFIGWCHKLDLFVVSVSLFIDTVVLSYIRNMGNSEKALHTREAAEVTSFLLVLSRSWRVVRIFHSCFEEYHLFQKQAEDSHHQNAIFRKTLTRVGIDPEKELEQAESAAHLQGTKH